MGINKIILVLLSFSSLLSLSQGVEIQRKYAAEKVIDLTHFISSSASIQEFNTHFHSEYIYYDLYFDTPGFDLKSKGLSLRLRKRFNGKDDYSYAFQLKSEMTSFEGVRMEVEEPELDFYKLIFEKEETNLAALLDVLFDRMMKAEEKGGSSNYSSIIAAISKWISFKATAPIRPFQKLMAIYPNEFTVDKITSLKPVIIGSSKRMRSHVYVDKDDLNKLKNAQSKNEMPDFFKKNKQAVWMIESSLDSSVFYPLFECSIKEVTITEFELENKYQNDSLGARFMDAFEMAIKDEFGLEKRMESKYLQSIKAFKIRE